MTVFDEISLECIRDPMELDLNLCLVEDEFINYKDRDVYAQALALTSTLDDPWEMIEAIYVFVRDEIIYDFAPRIENLSAWKASMVLKNRQGFCHQKAILQSALFRAVGIPSALVFQEIIDFPLMKSRFKKMIPNGVLPYHALGAVFIDNKWFRLDATLDSGLCSRRGYRVTTVKPGCETLLPEITQNGSLHFEIKHENGFSESYPRIFCDAFLKTPEVWEAWCSFVKRESLSM